MQQGQLSRPLRAISGRYLNLYRLALLARKRKRHLVEHSRSSAMGPEWCSREIGADQVVRAESRPALGSHIECPNIAIRVNEQHFFRTIRQQDGGSHIRARRTCCTQSLDNIRAAQV